MGKYLDKNGLATHIAIEKQQFATSAQGTKADNAVQYVSQTLTDAQKTQARSNIGAGTYSKPSSGIPASDLASGVIPNVPEEYIIHCSYVWGGGYIQESFSDVYAAAQAGKKIIIELIMNVGEAQEQTIIVNSTALIPQSGHLIITSDIVRLIDKTINDNYYYNAFILIEETLSTWQSQTSMWYPQIMFIDSSQYYANFRPDWNITDTASPQFIQNKPTIPSNVVQYTAQTLTDAQKTQARTNIGAGTYTKPSTGIPASDIANGVIPEIITFTYDPNDEPDGADIVAAIEQGNIVYIEYDNAVYSLVYFVVYGDSYEASFGVAIESEIYYLGFTYSEDYGTNWTYVYRNVPALSTNITADKTSDFKAATPKAVYDEVHPAVQSTQPQGGFLPNVEYNLGTLTGNVTFALASAVSGIGNKWYWNFKAGATAPTITWPTGLLWPQPDAEPPTIEANDEVEVEVKNGHIVALVFKPTS